MSNISSEKLLGKNNINFSCKAKNFSKQPFWHYTTSCTTKKILDSKQIHINNIASMNDKNEINLHKKYEYRIHPLCFCNNRTEKLPMWYLYSGIDGKGVSIGITPSKMLWLIRSIKYLKPKNGNKLLEIDKDFTVRAGWIYYKSKKENRIMFKNHWYTINNKKKFYEKNYFIKDYPWEYEKEFRIVIITKKAYNTLILNIPNDVYKNLKIKLAPEMSTNEKNYFHEKYNDLECVDSELNISMGLLNKYN